tara:strand:+ start:618 stop:785 length:168 start_codon:yes stop_codon:yes gene_type:complete
VDKGVVRAILRLATIPVAVIVGVAAREGARLATTCGCAALMHYTAFDAVYYGSFF